MAVILGAVMPAPAQPTSAPVENAAPTTQTTQQAAVVAIDGELTNFTRDFVFKSFAKARSAGAQTIILKINTPGGLVSAALDLTQFLRKQSDLYVIAYVENRAYSAGTMIALACNEVVMEPGAWIGLCAPISIDPTGRLSSLGAAERAKIETPILADFDASATRNGYDPLLVSSMVSVGRVVHWMQSPTGERRFVDANEYDKLLNDGWMPVTGVRNPLDASDTLLTIESETALKVGLSKATVNSVEELTVARNLHAQNYYVPSFGEEALELLGTGWMRMALLVAFLLSIYVAVHTPGHGIAEATALTTLGLLVGIPLLSGYAQWWELAIIFVGFALLAIELFLIPGFGVTGISGLVLIFVGLLLTFIPDEPGRSPFTLPRLAGTWQALQTGLATIVGAMAISLLIGFWIRRYLPAIPYFNRLILSTTAGEGGAGSTVIPGEEFTWPALGTIGQAATDLKPGGSGRFLDDAAGIERVVSVVSETGFVPSGTPISVREVAGNRIVVRPA